MTTFRARRTAYNLYLREDAEPLLEREHRSQRFQIDPYLGGRDPEIAWSEIQQSGRPLDYRRQEIRTVMDRV